MLFILHLFAKNNFIIWQHIFSDVSGTRKCTFHFRINQTFQNYAPLGLQCVICMFLQFQVSEQSYFSFQPVFHDWCNKGCRMVHIKDPLLLIGNSSPCDGSVFPLLLSEWSFSICPTQYNRKIKCVEYVVK